jgi:hypothetical protein
MPGRLDRVLSKNIACILDNNNNGLVIYFIIIQTNLHIKIYNLKLYKIKKENKENYDYVYIISAIF